MKTQKLIMIAAIICLLVAHRAPQWLVMIVRSGLSTVESLAK